MVRVGFWRQKRMYDRASWEVRKTAYSGNLLRFMDCIELIFEGHSL